MLSVCSFITFFFFWNEIKEMKTYRIWKRLVVVLVSSLCHVAGVFVVSTPRSAVAREPFRIESWDNGGVDEMGGWVVEVTCLYILININRTGQSSDSAVGSHRGSTVKRIFGEVKGSSVWWICYWSCDNMGGGTDHMTIYGQGSSQDGGALRG